MPNSRLLGALHLGEKSSFFLPDQTAPFTIMDAVPINLYQLKGMDKLEPFPVGGRDSFASSWGRKKKKKIKPLPERDRERENWIVL